MVLGKLPMSGRPTILITVGQGPLAVGAGGGGLDIFTLIFPFSSFSLFLVGWGWSGGAMVLGYLPVPGRPTIWFTVGQGPTALAVGAGGGCMDIFTLIYPFFPLSTSLWETEIPSQRAVKPQTTNQPTNFWWGGRVVQWSWVNFQCRGVLQF